MFTKGPMTLRPITNQGSGKGLPSVPLGTLLCKCLITDQTNKSLQLEKSRFVVPRQMLLFSSPLFREACFFFSISFLLLVIFFLLLVLVLLFLFPFTL